MAFCVRILLAASLAVLISSAQAEQRRAHAVPIRRRGSLLRSMQTRLSPQRRRTRRRRSLQDRSWSPSPSRIPAFPMASGFPTLAAAARSISRCRKAIDLSLSELVLGLTMSAPMRRGAASRSSSTTGRWHRSRSTAKARGRVVRILAGERCARRLLEALVSLFRCSDAGALHRRALCR